MLSFIHVEPNLDMLQSISIILIILTALATGGCKRWNTLHVEKADQDIVFKVFVDGEPVQFTSLEWLVTRLDCKTDCIYWHAQLASIAFDEHQLEQSVSLHKQSDKQRSALDPLASVKYGQALPLLKLIVEPKELAIGSYRVEANIDPVSQQRRPSSLYIATVRVTESEAFIID